jgi:hypothetical protein
MWPGIFGGDRNCGSGSPWAGATGGFAAGDAFMAAEILADLLDTFGDNSSPGTGQDVEIGAA